MARKPAARPAQTKTKTSTHTTSLLEWIAGGVGLIVLLLVVGVIGHEALIGERSPPAILVEAAGVVAVPGGHLVQIRVINRGGSPAAQVMVEGELATPGAPPETSEAGFDYVPDKATRKGGLFFTGDPKAGTLTLRAKGYVDP